MTQHKETTQKFLTGHTGLLRKRRALTQNDLPKPPRTKGRSYRKPEYGEAA